MTSSDRKAAQQRAAIDQMRFSGRRKVVIVDEIDDWPAEGRRDEPLILLTLLPGAWRDRITVRAWG